MVIIVNILTNIFFYFIKIIHLSDFFTKIRKYY